jgi:hypothetical protein
VPGRDPELLCDFDLREALGDERENLELARRETWMPRPALGQRQRELARRFDRQLGPVPPQGVPIARTRQDEPLLERRWQRPFLSPKPRAEQPPSGRRGVVDPSVRGEKDDRLPCISVSVSVPGDSHHQLVGPRARDGAAPERIDMRQERSGQLALAVAEVATLGVELQTRASPVQVADAEPDGVGDAKLRIELLLVTDALTFASRDAI